jgi:hypothetical protein
MNIAPPSAVEAALTAVLQADTGYPQSPGAQAPEPFVDENRGAEHLGVSPRTMQRWRMTGTEPPWFRIGRLAKYRIADLTTWAEAQARISTSDKIAEAWLACRRASTSDVGNSDCRPTRRRTSGRSETRS